MPQALFILAAAYALYRNPNKFVKNFTDLTDKKIRVTPILILLTVIIFLSGLNFILNEYDPEYTPSLFPQFVLMPLSVFIASEFRKKDVKILAYLVAIEVIVAMAEYFLGVSTFFTGLEHYDVFEESGLLYNTRPLGLSNNSSVLAIKCLLVILLIDFYRLYEGIINKLLWVLILVGCYLTFGRTVFVALFAFFAIKGYMWFRADKPVVDWFYTIVALVLFLVVSSQVILDYSEVILDQLTRNTKKVDLSGREKIWEFYLNFIKENPWFGNGSHKVWYGEYHAHNSFLQLIATHGTAISLFYFLILAIYLNGKNFIYVLTILIYALFQFAIFWGVSIIDVIYFVFLLKTGDPERLRFVKNLPEEESQ